MEKELKMEKHEAEKYNSRALMESYNKIANAHQEEFAGEITPEAAEKEQTAGGLMHTYAQMMDSYKEGTIDSNGDNREN